MNRFGDHFGRGDGGGVERRAPPGDIDREPREVDDASVTAVATQVVSRAHENTVNGAGLNAKRTEHALRVVDGKASDLETLAAFDAFFANVDAINRAGLCTLIASDAGR